MAMISSIPTSFDQFPDEIKSSIFRQIVNLESFVLCRQVSKLCNQLLNEEELVSNFVQNQLKLIYEQDPFNKKIELFFLENIEIITSTALTSTELVRKAFEALCSSSCLNPYKEEHQLLIEESKKCAEKRWILWRAFISKNVSLLTVEKETDFLREAIDKQLEKKIFVFGSQLKCNFDFLYESLGKKVVSHIKNVSSVWSNCCFPLCSLVLNLEPEREDFVLNAIIPTSSYYIERRNLSERGIPKPLNLNIPFLMQLLISKNVPMNTVFGSPATGTYFTKFIDAVDPKKVSGKEQNEKAKDFCFKNKKFLLEIGRMLWERSPDINFEASGFGRIKNLALDVLIIKKIKGYPSSSDLGFSIFDVRKIKFPRKAIKLLIFLKQEGISLMELKTKENTSFLCNIIDNMTTFAPKPKVQAEFWKSQWIKAAVLLMDMGEDPRIEVNHWAWSTIHNSSKVLIEPLAFAEKRCEEETSLSALINVFKLSSTEIRERAAQIIKEGIEKV